MYAPHEVGLSEAVECGLVYDIYAAVGTVGELKRHGGVIGSLGIKTLAEVGAGAETVGHGGVDESLVEARCVYSHVENVDCLVEVRHNLCVHLSHGAAGCSVGYSLIFVQVGYHGYTRSLWIDAVGSGEELHQHVVGPCACRQSLCLVAEQSGVFGVGGEDLQQVVGRVDHTVERTPCACQFLVGGGVVGIKFACLKPSVVHHHRHVLAAVVER